MKRNSNVPVILNHNYKLEIIDITKTGEGIAKKDNFTIFIDNTVPGDIIEAKISQIKSNYALGKVKKFLKYSNNRRENKFCKFEENCGGCQYSELNYKNQLEFKEKQVIDALERIGGFKNLKIKPIIPSQSSYYRNKAQFKINQNGLGFYSKKSHNLINLNQCKNQQESINDIIHILNKYLKEWDLPIYNEKTGKGLLRGILVRTNYNNEIIIVFIINGNNLPNQNIIIKQLSQNKSIIGIYLNINKQKGNQVLGKNNVLIYKTKDLIEHLGDKSFFISPSSFFQVNSKQTEILYNLIKKFANLNKNDILLDLYCGTGSIGIFISEENIPLIGIEYNSEAIKDANKNAQLNGLKNYKFYQGKAEEVISELTDKPTCIILDPPRKGCDEKLLEYLLSLKIEKIIYVSCNPATLARDLKILCTEYDIEVVQPIDLFPNTGHVETIVKLSLIKSIN